MANKESQPSPTIVSAAERFRNNKRSDSPASPDTTPHIPTVAHAEHRFEERAHAASRLRHAKDLALESAMEPHLLCTTPRSGFWQKNIIYGVNPESEESPAIFYTKQFTPPLRNSEPENEVKATLSLLYRGGTISKYDVKNPQSTEEFTLSHNAAGDITSIALRIDAYHRLERAMALRCSLLANDKKYPWECVRKHEGDFNNVTRIKSPPAKALEHYIKTFPEPLLENASELTPLGFAIQACMERLHMQEGTDYKLSADDPHSLQLSSEAYHGVLKRVLSRLENGHSR